MNQQNTTKKIISCSFKNLAIEKVIDKISITDIMDQTDYRRQTFYDHFDDKYDLITWIFSYDVTDLIQSIMKWGKWEEVLFHLINYLEENRTYYKKIVSNIKLDSFKDYFIYYIKQSIQTITDDYLQTHSISDSNHALVKTKIDFCAYGLSEMLYHWVLEDCEPNSADYHELLIKVIYFRI
ncbi:TetR/AcrR family transcriptional regulator C-terminal domain-containing protein [Carnobacterium funditum]|uniref:TetR/AcrR family transcriptional regulator C-terminal domain-containing protein n=1 Tax=Carnobacterium funditum TaxID=2752 RepID=UPI00055313DE|nr:TetR/AcrR family transcriptional regulator C-terminal domain-containing protein [Carnobacterium funditum]